MGRRGQVATGAADVAVVHSWGDVPLSIPEHVVPTPLTSDVVAVVRALLEATPRPA